MPLASQTVSLVLLLASRSTAAGESAEAAGECQRMGRPGKWRQAMMGAQ